MNKLDFKPMLAEDHDPSKLRFPYFVSPKYDGIRAFGWKGLGLTRRLKPVPNIAIQRIFQTRHLDYLDGELMVGHFTETDDDGRTPMQRTSSGVMSRDGRPEWRFCVFDVTHPDYLHLSYHRREAKLRERLARLVEYDLPLVLVPQRLVTNVEQLVAAEEEFLEQGYEGVMLRDPDGAYKQGRSTVRENLLLKVKRWADNEGRIVGYEERMHNANEAKLNELGRMKRSSHKANMHPTGLMGALVVDVLNGPFKGKRVNVPGFTHAMAKELWQTRHTLEGKVITFKWFPPGSMDAPRFPGFKSFRDERDMDA